MTIGILQIIGLLPQFPLLYLMFKGMDYTKQVEDVGQEIELSEVHILL